MERERLEQKLDTYIEVQHRLHTEMVKTHSDLALIVARHETAFLHLKWLVQSLAWVVSIVTALLAVKAWPWVK